jgi:hypothetical protein
VRRALPVALVLASLALPAAAQAAGTSTAITPGISTSPFAIGVPQVSTTATTATPTVASSSTTSSTDGSFSTLDILIIVVAVGALILGVVTFVLRDSRRTARQLGVAGSFAGEGTRSGSKAKPKSRKQISAREKKRRKRGRAPRRR